MLTYAEVDARASRLARYLSGLGCGPESRVGVALERDLSLLVTFLGVLKAGAVYVPLDLDSPRERLAFLLESSGLAALLIHEGLRDHLPIPAGLPVVEPSALPETDAGIARRSRRRLSAYIIHTSGSIGRPQGGHGAPRRHDQSPLGRGGGPGTRTGQPVRADRFAVFRHSIWQFLVPLLAGESVHIASQSTA